MRDCQEHSSTAVPTQQLFNQNLSPLGCDRLRLDCATTVLDTFQPLHATQTVKMILGCFAVEDLSQLPDQLDGIAVCHAIVGLVRVTCCAGEQFDFIFHFH